MTLAAYHSCDPCRATKCRTECRSKFLQFSRCRGDVALHPQCHPKSDPVAPILPPLCHGVAVKFSCNNATTLNPKAGLEYRGRVPTPARCTSPNSCSTGPALWEFFRKSAVLQGKRPWRTGEKVAKCRYCFCCLKVRGGSPPSDSGFEHKIEIFKPD